MIPFTKLNVGFANAENYRKRENKELLSKYFVRDDFLERMLDHNVYYVVGEKGTGKTAYSTYLRNNRYKEHRAFSYDVRQTEYHKFLELKRLGYLPLSQYTEVWRTLLLILAATSILEESGTPEFLKRFTKLGALKTSIDKFYGNAFAPEIVNILTMVESNEFAASLGVKHAGIDSSLKAGNKQEKTSTNSTFQTNLLQIRQSFEGAVTSLKLENDQIVFVDGIDVRPSDINYNDYYDCVSGLIDAIWVLNNDYLANIKDSRGRIRVVLLVRPDIFLKTGLHNVNTKLRDNAVFLKWTTTYKDYRSSSLFKVADRLLAAQQVEMMPPGTAWDHYFPFHAENISSSTVSADSGINSFLSFLRFSYYRPRDISAMIGTMREMLASRGEAQYVKLEHFNDPTFRDAHADYLLGEIRDQLLFYYSQTEFELFLAFFSHLNGRKKFAYRQFTNAFAEFILECSDSGVALPRFFESADTFLQFLFEQNVICYIEKGEDESGGEQFIRWCFRERTLSNLSPKVRTHVDYEVFYALTKALNVGRPIRIKKEKAIRQVGTVISLNKSKLFGFIRGGDKQAECYFKFDQVDGEASHLRLGSKVSYEVKIKYAKPRAEKIVLVVRRRDKSPIEGNN